KKVAISASTSLSVWLVSRSYLGFGGLDRKKRKKVQCSAEVSNLHLSEAEKDLSTFPFLAKTLNMTPSDRLIVNSLKGNGFERYMQQASKSKPKETSGIYPSRERY